jgi:hypothetical protein
MIYIIITEDQSAIKIGYTKSTRKDSVYKRMSHLQIGNHQKLSVLHYFHGNSAHESFLHGYLYRFRLNGEWFDYKNEMLRLFIERLIEGGLQHATRLFSPYDFDPIEAIENRKKIKYKTKAYLKKKSARAA